MANENKPQLKFYKGQTNGKTFYNLLPAFNVSGELQEVSNPNEIQTAVADYETRVIGGASGAEQAGLRQRLADYQAGTSTQFAFNEQGILAEPKQIAAQQTQRQAIASGQAINFGTAQAPLTVPKGTPSPQEANRAFQATLPPPKYDERFQQAHQAAKSAGVQPASTYEGAVDMFNQFLPSQQAPSAIDNFVTQDPYLNTTIRAYQDYMSQQNQRTSLVDEYQKLLKTSGIEAIDMDLINMKKVIEGTEDDIRTEVTKAGGFATDSQVIALSNARNKQIIKNYNTLLETRNSKAQYLDIVLNLTQQDRAEADRLFETRMNFGFKISELNQKMKQNAVESLERIISAIGFDGLFSTVQNDPHAISLIEKTYGLPRNGLYVAAQRAFQTRQAAEQERDLDIQLKQAQIAENGTRKLTEVSPGATLFDPATGKAIYTAPTAKKTDGLSEEKDAVRISNIQSFIDNKKGSNGLIAWETYQQAAQKWIGQGGTTSDFKTAFPAESLMDKGNLNKLPESLQPTGYKPTPTVQDIQTQTEDVFKQYQSAGYSRKQIEDQWKSENNTTSISPLIKGTLDKLYPSADKKWWEFWK